MHLSPPLACPILPCALPSGYGACPFAQDPLDGVERLEGEGGGKGSTSEAGMEEERESSSEHDDPDVLEIIVKVSVPPGDG